MPHLSDVVQTLCDERNYQDLSWEGGLEEYLDLVKKNPRIARTAFQRLYDMILSHGTEEYTDSKKAITRYKFFSDPLENGKDAIFGLDLPLMKMVNLFKASAMGYGAEKRLFLLHGPVGSSKSTIARLLKKGLEAYSKTAAGALYTFSWVKNGADGETFGNQEHIPCPMHEEPLHLVPVEIRQGFFEKVNEGAPNDRKIQLEGDLCPPCRYIYRSLLNRYRGEWKKVASHVRVQRLILSEKDRIGIGTFQPKDEKNQDSTELTGDMNYRKIAEYGSDSDPRAFNFDGEFNIANRGMVEFIEMLKLDVAFLYDLLGASQEHRIKPKKFAQTDIDEVILGHTNEAEYRKLQNNEYMEALRDRTLKIDIPYITKLHEETRIYERDFNSQRIRGKHIAPHTLEMAAMWAVLTRMEEPKKANLTLMQKLKLYDGRPVPGYTEESVKELRKEAVREGMDGISPRYIQDKISNALVMDRDAGCVNPFMVLRELESGLKHHSLLKNEEQRKRFLELLSVAKDEYEDLVKHEVQQAVAADEDAISRLCANYIDHVKAYTQREKVKNRYSGQYEEPDERLMRQIEEKIDIPEGRKDDFRREIMNYIGALAIEGKVFSYRTNERLRHALELKLFEDQKDSIRLTTVSSVVSDLAYQDKIAVVKNRLVKNFGYCEVCSSDILSYVSSIFARGDVKGKG
ncbi:MAG: serine protein kinase [Deltaproteobacteria bacterium]|nr:serine protein kinase [Deltaproteobacteria bacterium]